MGISYLVSNFCLWYAIFFPYKNILIVSLREREAKRFLEKIKIAYKALPEYMQLEITNGKKGDYGTTTLMEFTNGSRIESVPTSKDAGRSEGLSLLVIDEAGFVSHIEDIWAAARPTLATGGSCIIMSTMNGIGNFFYQTWTKALEKANSFNPIKLHYKMFPGRDEVWAAKELADLGPLRYAQEVLCEALTSGRAYFNLLFMREQEEEVKEKWDKKQRPIDKVMQYFKEQYAIDESNYIQSGSHGRPPVYLSEALISKEDLLIWEEPRPEARYCMGCDAAKALTDEHDNQALQIVNYETNELALEYMGKISTSQYTYLIMYLSFYYNDAFTAIESNSIGWSIIELLLELGFPEDSLYTQIKHQRKRSQFEEDQDTETFGFYTSQTTKPIILQYLQGLYEDGSFKQRSVRAINQHYTYHWLNNTAIGALPGYCDDLVMASAITQECRKKYEPYFDVGMRVG